MRRNLPKFRLIIYCNSHMNTLILHSLSRTMLLKSFGSPSDCLEFTGFSPEVPVREPGFVVRHADVHVSRG